VALPVLALGLVLGVVALAPVLGAGLAAGPGGPGTGRGRLVTGGVAALAAVQLGLLVGSGPSSLGWTMPGLRPEHRWAGTQATDLGQDRDRLADWADERAAAGQPVAAALLMPLGEDLPDGVRSLDDVPADELTGWVAVSASRLVTFGPELSWLRAHCNVGSVGRSILLYRFAEPPDRGTGPGLPVAACPGATTSHRR
jgi:hypothetical protein